MECEVCGRRITGKTYKAIIEGARLVVCSDCTTLGSISWELHAGKPKPRHMRPRRIQKLEKKSKVVSKQGARSETSYELVEDFGTRIRQAREARGLSHETLGRKINEKISVLKKVEIHKMTPDNKLAEKLEHALKIELLVLPIEEQIPKKHLVNTPSKPITLGDLIRGRKKPSEETR